MSYKKKEHHYVSQFYLKYFAFNLDDPKDVPKIHQMTKEGIIPSEPNKVEAICKKKNYNTQKQECNQSQLERTYANYVRKHIKSHGTGKTTLDHDILEFISFMVGNNIFVREKLVDGFTIKGLEQNGIELTNKIVMDKSIRGKYDWSMAFSSCVSKELQNWMFADVKINTNQKGVITSDNPFNIFNSADIFTPIEVKLKYDDSKAKASMSNKSENRIDLDIIVPLINVSFGHDVIMTFPITPELCLMGFSDSVRFNRFREGTTKGEISKLVEIINIMTFSQANKAVYSHSKELLLETRENLISFRNYFNSNNLVPSFEMAIR